MAGHYTGGDESLLAAMSSESVVVGNFCRGRVFNGRLKLPVFRQLGLEKGEHCLARVARRVSVTLRLYATVVFVK